MAENSTGSGFYEQFWDPENISATSEAVLRLSRILWALTYVIQMEQGKISGAAVPRMSICDLGCGYGWLAGHLQTFGDVTGIDSSPKGIAVARESYPQIRFELADATEYRAETPFDMIISSEVIEHVEDKNRFAETVKANLKEGGHLILTCPNGNRENWQGTRKISDQPIEEWPTPRELRSLFSDAFTILHHDTFRIDYSNQGIMRFVNSYKVRKSLRNLYLLPIYESLVGRFNLGLYQLLIAKKQ